MRPRTTFQHKNTSIASTRRPTFEAPSPEISPNVPSPQQGFALLQRNAGNAALQRMFARNNHNEPDQSAENRANAGLPRITQRTTGSAAQREMIQRLIGFEIETRIPWYTDDTETGQVRDLGYNELDIPSKAGNAKLSVDNDGSDSIIEYVTDPVDDLQDSDSFKKTATTWAKELGQLRNWADTTPPVRRLDGLYSSAPDDIFFGFLKDNGNPNKVAIQVTHGLQLGKVKDYFGAMKLPKGVGSRFQQKEDSFGESITALSPEVLATIEELMVTRKGFIFKSRDEDDRKDERQQAMPDLEGFLLLISHYLTLGGKGIQSYLKNRISLFYKSKLSEVRNDLLAKYPITGRIFGSSSGRSKVKNALLKATDRSSGEALFKIDMPKGAKKSDSNRNSVTKCGVWIEHILKGEHDIFFNEAKNSWATDIAPGKVDNELAVVLEHRDLAAEMDTAALSLETPSTIVDFLVSIYETNQARQGLGQEDDASSSEESD